ncbi:MAG: bifunctional [glutamine synthetase] adenylyltransferase/[glutamine synthetase]-adenylyl-L-tyrosine phosphorylase [Alphaproteobacteria bacterium]|nr:MAG: bifunctional [glutamine synthetase] adenylyltransferase/[glutamine synthetase]-adenylyl-L-tyrosine phosphorylase [Alphaproteobacteria bacterium]
MRLADLIQRFPLPVDAARGAEARARLEAAPEAFAALVEGAAGASRFLNAAITAEADWLHGIASARPEDSAAALLAPLETEPDASPDRALRLRKRRVALLTALADLGGVWSLEQVTGFLTDFADLAVASALAHHLAQEIRRGRLPRDAPPPIVLAMGKMGAGELNYSSDIDLICLFDEDRHPAEDYADIRSGYVRVIQRMVRSLSAVTADGYVFRTDLRLRPDPAVTPVCIGAGMAEAYYESVGRNWERAALIKARPCAGDIAGGEAFLQAIAPFIWRRHLDFAAIEDAYDMQRRIRAHKRLREAFEFAGHDVKLGRGGIRAIEFFAQTRQLICGGRDPDLRLRGTVQALAMLARKGWISEDVSQALVDAYRRHRMLEHRIQMLEDAQTHLVPTAAEGQRRLAALYGESDIEAFGRQEIARFERVHGLTEAFFAPAGFHASREIGPETLARLGYADPDGVIDLIERWLGGRIAATRTERARAILARLLPEITQRLAKAASPDDAIRRFDAFLSGLPAGVQILSLFEANPQLLDLLAEICAASPRLATALSQYPLVLDAVLEPDFFQPQPDTRELTRLLREALGRTEDYEEQLDIARRWARERGFRTGVQLLRGVARAEEAGHSFSDIAEAALRALLPIVQARLERRHGPPPGRGVAVLGMGKLGSREMTITSDLDLIIVYDPAGETESRGPKPLAVTAYYARLTQALISALTAPTAEGQLYKVDMRLRPSGRQGPVAVSLAGFAGYQREEAWTWEHMALTRARVVAGEPGLGADVDAVIEEVLSAPRDRDRLMADVREMRGRIARARAGRADSVWDVKRRPGGMLDIELVCQAGMLATGLAGIRAPIHAIAPLRKAGFLDDADAETLADALGLAIVVQHYGRLAMEGPLDPEAAGAGFVEALIRATDAPDLATLQQRLETGMAAAAAVVEGRLGGK